ncbi:MAG TPA: hypothetical protein VGQ12_13225 [Candidatus Angelobacter sp.]|nr:hypothetical protein [Candidatus Angelobacter sp.]
MGLIIDVVIAYSIKLTLRFGRAWGSSSWKLLRAKIASSEFDDNWVWNCPTVHIVYTYEIDGQTYSETDSKPFFFSRLGKEDAERFKPGETAVVRVDPHQPQKSILRRVDQKNPARLSE